MTAEHERDLAEVILRTRRQAFREAFPEILGVVRQIAGGDRARDDDELRRGAEQMIRDYRTLLARWPDAPPV